MFSKYLKFKPSETRITQFQIDIVVQVEVAWHRILLARMRCRFGFGFRLSLVFRTSGQCPYVILDQSVDRLRLARLLWL